MDIMERIGLLLQCGFSDKEDYDDLCKIISIFRDDFKIELTEENSGVMITHMAAAFKRNTTGEEISPLDESVFEDVEDSDMYALANEIVTKIESGIENRITGEERKFFLLHICTLLDKVS